MNEGQLMGDFESDSKQLEAESWSRIVDSKFLKQQKKDVVKRQEVIYGEMLHLLCLFVICTIQLAHSEDYWEVEMLSCLPGRELEEELPCPACLNEWLLDYKN